VTESPSLSSLLNDVRAILQEARGKAYAAANTDLRNFRQFYLAFPNAEKRYALRSKLSWTHWRLIMRVEDSQARDYYKEELQAELERRHIFDWPQSAGGETS
jgi:hypothetical protein